MPKKSKAMKFKRAPNAPKRFKSAFMIFSAHRHRMIRDGSADEKLRSSDIAKMISRAWKELPDIERVTWQQKAKLDRERYEREKAAYKGPWKVPNVKDPNAPKKPMSAFLAFGNERRRAIATANPTMNGTEISCLLSKLWKECPEDVKKVYREKEAMEREIFKKRRAEWLRKKKEAELESDSYSDGSDERHECDSFDLESSCHENCSQQESFPDQPLPIAGGPSEWDTSDWLTFGALPIGYSPNAEQSTTNRQIVWQSSAVENAQQSSTTHPPALHLSCNLTAPLSETKMLADLRCQTDGTNGLRDKSSILSNCATVSCASSSSHKPTRSPPGRFENYSMEDILEDEELFEDFSPSDVPTFVPSFPSLL